MTLNRCCREIGADLTMFTQFTRTGGGNILSTDPKYVESIFGGNEFLRTLFTPAQTSPSQEGRYSRYSSFPIANPSNGSVTPTSSPYHQAPLIEYDPGTTGPVAKAISMEDN